jgi:2-beta-glucuronyltransferase
MGFGARKASTVFFAEGLARLGWQIDFVTAQLSLLSVLAGVPRLKMVPDKQRNTWIERGNGISTFVWLPPFHPATTGFRLVNRMATPLFYLYPHLLPETIRRRVRSSQLIIIESCSAVMLFPLLKKLAPNATFIYRACDPLDAIGMHPILETVLNRTAADYDLFTSPSKIILETFPSNVKTCYLPQGIQKSLFDVSVPSPFEGNGPHAIIAGDMMFDLLSFEMMVRNFPHITFHAFGRMELGDLISSHNLIHYGEVPFETLRDYMVHANFGIAPYLDRPDVRYLTESSLKFVQYTYARLPILAPSFCKGGRDHLKCYTPGDEASIILAVEEVCRVDRRTIDRSDVYDWHETVAKMLRDVDLPGDVKSIPMT